MPKDPSPGGPYETKSIKSSKNQNYCSAGKPSQKNATKSLSSEELLAMLNPVFEIGRKASFPLHTLNRVTAINLWSVFSLQHKLRPNATAALLCTLLQ